MSNCLLIILVIGSCVTFGGFPSRFSKWCFHSFILSCWFAGWYVYQFKCPLGDCISDNNNIYVGLTSTTLSRRLTMHLSDTSSIAQHLKKHSCPTKELRKMITDNTTILEHQNNKQKLQILEALHIRNMQLTLYRINFQTSANVLKCL